VACALAVGRRIAAARQKGEELPPVRGSYTHILIGALALYGLGIFATVLDLGGAPLAPFSLLFKVLGIFVAIFASILGYGALLTSRFGTERALAGVPPMGPRPPFAQAPPPPPPPPAPEAPAPSAPPA
jgi:hypothetical protein